MVKEEDSKSSGLCLHRFKSCYCRSDSDYIFYYGSLLYINIGHKRPHISCKEEDPKSSRLGACRLESWYCYSDYFSIMGFLYAQIVHRRPHISYKYQHLAFSFFSYVRGTVVGLTLNSVFVGVGCLMGRNGIFDG